MGVSYRIYSNGGTSAPVDYSKPLATVSALTYAVGPLLPSSDYTFVVHSVDTTNQLEEANTDARVRILTDDQGNDVSSRPNPVQAVSMVPLVGGGARVSWSFIPNGRPNRPAEFVVRLSTPANVVASVNVPYMNEKIGYTCDFPGPLAIGGYSASVSSVGNQELNSSAVSIKQVLGLSQEPFVIDSLTIH